MKKIKVPKELFMVGKDKKNLKGNFYHYQVKAINFNPSIAIEPKWFNQPVTWKQFMSSLFYSYQEKSLEKFKSLMSETTRKMFNKMDSKRISDQLEVVFSITKPKVNYLFRFNDGLIVSWKDPLFRQSRQIFIKKKDGVFFMTPFKATKEDHRFWNINTYFAGAPFEIKTAKLEKSFHKISDGQIKQMVFKVSKEGHFVHLFKQANKKINLSIQDNKKQKQAPIMDSDKTKKRIVVDLKGEHFYTEGKNVLYYLESSYPMSKINSEQIKKAKKITINKE